MVKNIGTKNKNKVDFDSKRLQEIEVFEYSLNQICNPSVKHLLVRNRISLEINLMALEEIKRELEVIDIDINDIDIHSVFSNGTSLTELELYIKSINNGLDLSSLREAYKEHMQEVQINKLISKDVRQKRVFELENIIKKELININTFGKLNKGLKAMGEKKVAEAREELLSIEETLKAPTEQEIKNKLWNIAYRKIEVLKHNVGNKIEYLRGVQANAK